MSKKVKTENGSRTVLPAKKTAVEFISAELDKLREQQADCERQAVRGRKLLNFLIQQPTVENNAAELIVERLGGLNGDGKYSDVVIETILSALTSDWLKENGRFVCWFLELTADITYEKTRCTLWSEDDVWPVFMCVARFLKSTKALEEHGNKLVKCLEMDDKVDCSDADNIDWETLVKAFLDALDGDHLVETFRLE